MLFTFILTILLTALGALFLSSYLGRNGTILVVLLANLLMASITIFNIVCFSSSLFSIVNFSEHYIISWSFFLDLISILLLLVILFITTAVLLLPGSYMHGRFFFYFVSFLQFFMLIMLILLLSGNLVQVFIDWQWLGIVSFILSNFWCYYI